MLGDYCYYKSFWYAFNVKGDINNWFIHEFGRNQKILQKDIEIICHGQNLRRTAVWSMRSADWMLSEKHRACGKGPAHNQIRSGLKEKFWAWSKERLYYGMDEAVKNGKEIVCVYSYTFLFHQPTLLMGQGNPCKMILPYGSLRVRMGWGVCVGKMTWNQWNWQNTGILISTNFIIN